MARLTLAALLATATALVAGEAYTWKNVYTGAGGGWIGNVIFNPSKKGLGMYTLLCIRKYADVANET